MTGHHRFVAWQTTINLIRFLLWCCNGSETICDYRRTRIRSEYPIWPDFDVMLHNRCRIFTQFLVHFLPSSLFLHCTLVFPQFFFVMVIGNRQERTLQPNYNACRYNARSVITLTERWIPIKNGVILQSTNILLTTWVYASMRWVITL